MITPVKNYLAREFLNRKFIKFLMAGGVAAIVNILSRIGFSIYLDYIVAIVLAYCVGMLTAFLLNRQFVFGAGKNSIKLEMGRFILVNLVALLQIGVISILLAWVLLPMMGITRGAETIAHIIGVSVPVFTSYLFHKHWTFRGNIA